MFEPVPVDLTFISVLTVRRYQHLYVLLSPVHTGDFSRRQFVTEFGDIRREFGKRIRRRSPNSATIVNVNHEIFSVAKIA